MARRIKDAFAGGKAFIAFITAGDPNLAATEEYILEMERAGADLIEIGIPFSDPIAEGVVIQEADLRALRSGTTTDKIFDMRRRTFGRCGRERRRTRFLTWWGACVKKQTCPSYLWAISIRCSIMDMRGSLQDVRSAASAESSFRTCLMKKKASARRSRPRTALT